MSVRSVAALVLAVSLMAAACGDSSKASPTVTPAPTQTAVASATSEPATQVAIPFTPVEEVLTPPPDIDTSSWLIYTDETNGFELKYPPDATVKRDVLFGPMGVPQVGTLFELFVQAGTALAKKSFFVSSPDSAREYCRSELTASSQTPRRVRIVNETGEFSFWSTRYPGIGGASEWIQTNYFTEKGESCISLKTWLLLGTLGLHPTGTRLADKDAESQALLAMLATFRWLS